MLIFRAIENQKIGAVTKLEKNILITIPIRDKRLAMTIVSLDL